MSGATRDVTFAPDPGADPRIVHGGTISAAVYELMADVILASSEALVVCSSLRVRFLQPVRPGEQYQVTARPTGTWPGGFHAAAEICGPDGGLAVAAVASYRLVRPEQWHAADDGNNHGTTSKGNGDYDEPQ